MHGPVMLASSGLMSCSPCRCTKGGRLVPFILLCMMHSCDLHRTFLIRDVMDEMLLNGLAPDRVFLELSITHCMRASRIGDCFYYYNEMQRRGMQPSSKLQGLLISVLSREGHLEAAEEVRQLSLSCPNTQHAMPSVSEGVVWLLNGLLSLA